MPLRERRNLTVKLTCQRPGCGVVFHPFRGRESGPNVQKYCGHACSVAAGVYARLGIWPEMRAGTAGETDGDTNTATTTARRGSAEPLTLDLLPALPLVSAEALGAAWRERGERWEVATTNAVEREARRGTGRTLILAGHGAGLPVERGALVAQDGRTHSTGTPIRHVLYRGVHDVARILWLHAAGSLTFAAVEWCATQGITVSLLDSYGTLISTLTPEAPTDVALRRAQYRAQDTGQDVALARELVCRKLERQRGTIRAHPELPNRERAREALDMALSWLSLPDATPYLSTMDGIRVFEGRTARAYFAAWVGLPVNFARADRRRIPPHWQSVRERTSPLAGNRNARHAVDPTNALLNYAYGCLESQVRQALTANGFDLSCGLLHSDRAGRDSLVYDLMECERGAVDSLVLALIGRTVFRVGDFTPVTDGSVRLHPQLARAVVATCRVPQDQIDEHARWLRSALLGKTAQDQPQDLAAVPCSVAL
jgi:CRISP-associated protein Cas1